MLNIVCITFCVTSSHSIPSSNYQCVRDRFWCALYLDSYHRHSLLTIESLGKHNSKRPRWKLTGLLTSFRLALVRPNLTLVS